MYLQKYLNRPDLRENIYLEDIVSEDDDFSDLVDDYGFSICGAGRLAKQVKAYREVVGLIDDERDLSFDVDELTTNYIGSLSYDVGRELNSDVSEESVDEMADKFYNRLVDVEGAGTYSSVDGFWIDLHPSIYGLSKSEVTELFKQSVGLALVDEEGYTSINERIW